MTGTPGKEGDEDEGGTITVGYRVIAHIKTFTFFRMAKEYQSCTQRDDELALMPMCLVPNPLLCKSAHMHTNDALSQLA